MQLFDNPRQPRSTTQMVSLCIEAWASRTRRHGSDKGAFVLDGAKVSDAELGSATGLLPVLAWHAENLYRYGIRRSGLGFRYTEDDESLLQRAANLDRTDRGISEVLCFLIEATEDAHQHLPRSTSTPGATELRSLVNQFTAAMGLPATVGMDSSMNARPQL